MSEPKTIEKTAGKSEPLEQFKVRSVEGLLQLHNDEQTTREINEEWRRFRAEIDQRAKDQQSKVTGEVTIKIKYAAIDATGRKEVTISHGVKLPPKPKNTKELYEDASGVLQTVKPTKQIDMFDNVRPIKQGV